MKRTYQPSRTKRNRKFGFRARMKTKGGRLVLKGADKKVELNYQSPMRKNLTKKEILRNKAEINRVFRSNQKFSCRGSKIIVLPNELPYDRILVTLVRKFGNSIQRNRTKRISKEIFRNSKDSLVPGYDIIYIVYPGDYSYAQREEQLLYLFSKAGLLK